MWFPTFVCPDAVLLNLGLFSCKNEVMKMLFPPIVRNVTKSLQVTPASDSENLQIKWGLIREMSDAIQLLRKSSDGNLKSLFLRKKGEVEEHLNVLITAAVSQLEQTAVDKNLICELTSLIEELNQFCSSLDKREFDFKSLWEVEELLKRLEARRPQLDTLFMQKEDTNDGSIVSVDEKVEDSAIVVNNVSKNAAECSTGKAKKKNNKTSKKGKKGVE